MTLRYGPGDAPGGTTPGDILLVHRRGLYSKAIAFGQRRRFRGPDRGFCRWSHVACIAGWNGELVEALGHGVQETHIDRYRDVEYHIVNINAAMLDREQMARFLQSCVGRGYGWTEIVSIAFSLLTGSHFGFGSATTLICSGLAAQSLCRGDAIFDYDPSRVLPADIAKHFGVRP